MTGIRKITLAFWFIALALPIAAQTTGKLSRTASSSIRSARDKNGNDVIITTNRRFTFVSEYLSQDYRPMVLLEEFWSEWTLGAEGNRAKIRVDGWVGDNPNPNRKAWTIFSEGDEGKVDWRFYKVKRYGCCADPSTEIWFNLIDGRKVLTSSINPLRVNVSNSSYYLPRYFAWHSCGSSIEPPELKTVNDLQGVLQYSSERESLRRLLVRSKLELSLSKIAIRHQGELLEGGMGLIKEVSLEGMSGNKGKSVFSEFSVVLMFDDSPSVAAFELEIPVENDELQIGKTKVPDKVILEFAKSSSKKSSPSSAGK
jgi:hypothetical protein